MAHVAITKGSRARMAILSAAVQLNPKRSKSAQKNAPTIHATSASKIHNSSLRVFIWLPLVVRVAAAFATPPFFHG